MAGHRGDQATARGYLRDPDGRVRSTALTAVERCGALDDDDLELALADTDPIVRCRAAELSVNHPAVSLLGLLEDEDDAVVEVAAWASGERSPAEPGVIQRLSAIATDSEDPLCRESAVAALGAIGDDQGLPTILAATTDIAPVRRRAVIALAPFSGPEVDEALERACTDRDRQVRQSAEDLLG